MRYLYGLQKTAAQKKQAFASKLSNFMRANRGVDYSKTASAKRDNIRSMIKSAAYGKTASINKKAAANNIKYMIKKASAQHTVRSLIKAAMHK